MDFLRDHARSWGVKIAFGIIIIVFVFYLGFGGFSSEREGVLVTVDNKPILQKDFNAKLENYARALREQKPGVDHNEELNSPRVKQLILSRMVLEHLLKEEADKLGIFVSDTELVQEIKKEPSFFNEQKQFDEKIYTDRLTKAGITKGDYESEIRNSLLFQKLTSYISLPAEYSDDELKSIFSFAQEKAKISYMLFATDEFAKAFVPKAEDIKSYYEKHQESFKKPATIKIEYIHLTPQSLAKPEAVSDEEAKSYYEFNKEKYSHAEMVQLSHILLPVSEAAKDEDLLQTRAKLDELAVLLRTKKLTIEDLAKKKPAGLEKIVIEDLGWLERGILPQKEFENAAFALDKDGVSEVVRTQLGLHIIRILDKKTESVSPFAEVKDEIKKEVALEKAMGTVRELGLNLGDDILGGKELASAAKDRNVEIKTSEVFSMDNPPAFLKNDQETLNSLFSLAPGSITEAALPTQEGLILAKILEAAPEAAMSLEETKPKVIEILKKEEARKQAEANAREVLDKISKPETKEAVLEKEKERIKVSSAFDRSGFIPELGQLPQLTTNAFAAKNKDWFKTVFPNPNGFIIARLEEKVPVEIKAWDDVKESVRQEMTARRGMAILEAYTEQLEKRASIKAGNLKAIGLEQ